MGVARGTVGVLLFRARGAFEKRYREVAPALGAGLPAAGLAVWLPPLAVPSSLIVRARVSDATRRAADRRRHWRPLRRRRRRSPPASPSWPAPSPRRSPSWPSRRPRSRAAASLSTSRGTRRARRRARRPPRPSCTTTPDPTAQRHSTVARTAPWRRSPWTTPATAKATPAHRRVTAVTLKTTPARRTGDAAGGTAGDRHARRGRIRQHRRRRHARRATRRHRGRRDARPGTAPLATGVPEVARRRRRLGRRDAAAAGTAHGRLTPSRARHPARPARGRDAVVTDG